jgi:hypothetical protein
VVIEGGESKLEPELVAKPLQVNDLVPILEFEGVRAQIVVPIFMQKGICDDARSGIWFKLLDIGPVAKEFTEFMELLGHWGQARPRTFVSGDEAIRQREPPTRFHRLDETVHAMIPRDERRRET